MGRSEIDEVAVEQAHIALKNAKIPERLVVPAGLQTAKSNQDQTLSPATITGGL